MVAAKRGVSLFLLAFGLCMAIAALSDRNWVDQKQVENTYGRYKLGLQEWQIVDKPILGDSEQMDYDNAGAAPYAWNAALLGPQADWRDAGRGALGLGVIGVIAIGFACIFTLIALVKAEFSKAPGAIFAFLSGFCFLLGAIIYEGVRPSWGGDMGYNYPIGLYLAAGLMAEISAIVLWSADYVSEAKAGRYSGY